MTAPQSTSIQLQKSLRRAAIDSIIAEPDIQLEDHWTTFVLDGTDYDVNVWTDMSEEHHPVRVAVYEYRNGDIVEPAVLEFPFEDIDR